MESMHEPVAVLGIGAMGHGMATSALRAGIRTIVWNRNPAATRDLAALGAAGTTSNLARALFMVSQARGCCGGSTAVAAKHGGTRCTAQGGRRDL